ncbi:MAG: ABC transporter substrate-binding protein [Alphaproteobacteria bacterium]|nr:ABC transporter substrate-binding protein [Alphaproteobacteria bacterium]
MSNRQDKKGHTHTPACECGPHSAHDLSRHAGSSLDGMVDGGMASLVQPTLVRAVFSGSLQRRHLLQTLGWAGAIALLKDLLPIASLEAMAAEKKPLEKADLTLGFLPITCAAPLLLADQLGLFKEAGLDVELVKTPGWAVVRDRLIKGEYDASHILSPMPLATTLGIGMAPTPLPLALIQNTNGSAITIASKHAQKRKPEDWKGFRFGIPFEASPHNFLLRYFLAEHGLEPDKDYQTTVISPPEMLAQLKAGTIDGFIVAEPFNQIAVQQGVGYIHSLSCNIWGGHPCCGFSVNANLIKAAPNSYLALAGAVVRGALHAQDGANRKDLGAKLSPAKYLNQPPEVLDAIFTGTFQNGLGETVTEPKRIEFDPMPYHSFAVWMLTQMKRWGMAPDDLNYAKIAEQVFLAADAAPVIKDAGGTVKDTMSPGFTIMGKVFDPGKPEDYVKSFAIRKS